MGLWRPGCSCLAETPSVRLLPGVWGSHDKGDRQHQARNGLGGARAVLCPPPPFSPLSPLPRPFCHPTPCPLPPPPQVRYLLPSPHTQSQTCDVQPSRYPPSLGAQGFQERSVTRLEPTWTATPPPCPSHGLVPVSGYHAPLGQLSQDMTDIRQAQAARSPQLLLLRLPSRRSFGFVYPSTLSSRLNLILYSRPSTLLRVCVSPSFLIAISCCS